MVKCAALKCRSGYRPRKDDLTLLHNGKTPPCKKRVFSFPKRPELRRKWINALCRPYKQWNPSNFGVCEAHFTARDFRTGLVPRTKTKRKRLRLKCGAVPSVFNNYPTTAQPSVVQMRVPETSRVKASSRRCYEEKVLEKQTQCFVGEDIISDLDDLHAKLLNDLLPPGYRLVMMQLHNGEKILSIRVEEVDEATSLPAVVSNVTISADLTFSMYKNGVPLLNSKVADIIAKTDQFTTVGEVVNVLARVKGAVSDTIDNLEATTSLVNMSKDGDKVDCDIKEEDMIDIKEEPIEFPETEELDTATTWREKRVLSPAHSPKAKRQHSGELLKQLLMKVENVEGTWETADDEEDRNALSQVEEELMPPPARHSEGTHALCGQPVHPGRPLTTKPNHKELGRRFVTTAKRSKPSSGDELSSSEEAEAAESQVIPRKQPQSINLTAEQEHDVVEWLQKHELFYNKKLNDYKDFGKKSCLLQGKADDLNIDVNQLRCWIQGMKTRFRSLYDTCSGQEALMEKLTQRNQWIYTSFHFLRPHIVPNHARRSKDAAKKLKDADLAGIAALHRRGKSTKEISQETGVSFRSVQRWTKRFREAGSDGCLIIRKRPGRSRLISCDTIRLVVQSQLEKNPHITSQELKEKNPELLGTVSARTLRDYLHRDLNYKRSAPPKKPFLNKKHCSNRLKFCKKYLEWDLKQWRTVLWSDEAQFDVTENPYDLKQATVKHPDSLMVWGTFSYHGTGSLVVLPKNTGMNQHNYQEVLKEELGYSFEKTGCDFFMQDGAPHHTATRVKKWLRECGVRFFEDWPGNSPDLNPIKNLWAIIKGKLARQDTSSVPKLEAAIRDIWSNLDPAYLNHLAESLPWRLQKCVEANGKHIKY